MDNNIISFEEAKDQKLTKIIEAELNDAEFMKDLDARMESIYQRSKDINNNVLNTKIKIF